MGAAGGVPILRTRIPPTTPATQRRTCSLGNAADDIAWASVLSLEEAIGNNRLVFEQRHVPERGRSDGPPCGNVTRACFAQEPRDPRRSNDGAGKCGIRAGYQSVNSYLVADSADALIKWLCEVFGCARTRRPRDRIRWPDRPCGGEPWQLSRHVPAMRPGPSRPTERQLRVRRGRRQRVYRACSSGGCNEPARATGLAVGEIGWPDSTIRQITGGGVATCLEDTPSTSDQ